MPWAHSHCVSRTCPPPAPCSNVNFWASHLEIFPNPAALAQRYSSKEPKLILAVPASLSHGASRVLFSEFAETPDNVVLLTGRGEEGTLGRMLFERWNNSQREESKWDRGKIGNNIMMDGTLHLSVRMINRARNTPRSS